MAVICPYVDRECRPDCWAFYGHGTNDEGEDEYGCARLDVELTDEDGEINSELYLPRRESEFIKKDTLLEAFEEEKLK